MIALDELLIKIGIDGEQAKQINTYVSLLQMGADKIGANTALINEQLDGLINDVSQSLDNASEASKKATEGLNKAGHQADKAGSKFSKLKLAMVALVGGAMLFGNKIASAFNSAVGNAETLFKSKNALYSISKAEIAQVEGYKKSLDKTSLSINSIKTKIAINLIPTITAVSEKFNGWLVTNKDLVTNGIGKVILWLGKGAQVITNFIKFIDKVVRSTIGWKNAFIALGVAWAILNRAFLFSPIGMLIVAFGALLLLVDDLMVYMAGGKSLFGSYWDPLISGGKKVVEWFKANEKIWKPILIGLVTYLSLIGLSKWAKDTVKGVSSIGKAFKGLRSIVMGHPILAIISAIAVGAYLVYKNWDRLSTQFKKIWGNISSFCTDAWKTIVDTVSNAIKEVLMYFGMSESGANKLVADIGKAFSMIFDLICYPFKLAYDFINELLNIWSDDNTTFIEKLGKSFVAITDFITAPFKDAMVWIKDKFMGFIDGIKGAIGSVFSFFGGDSGDGSVVVKQEDFNRYFEASIKAPNVPSPNNVNTSSVTNNIENKPSIAIYATDTKEGARKAGNDLLGMMERSNDLINTKRMKS